MKMQTLPSPVRRIFHIACIVQAGKGFALGVALFIWGTLLFETFSRLSNQGMALTLTAVLIQCNNGLRMLLEVPTGAFADVLGRKRAVVWSLAFCMGDLLLLALIPFGTSVAVTMGIMVLSIISYGFSYTLFSGTFTAWCVDQLRVLAPDVGYEQLLGRANTCNLLACLAGGILGVGLFLQGLPWVAFLAGAIVCFALIIFCLAEMPSEPQLDFLSGLRARLPVITRRMGEIVGVSIQVFRHSPIIAVSVVIFASYMFLLNMIEYFWPVYVRSTMHGTEQAAWWLGMVVLVLLSSASGSHFLTWWGRRRPDPRKASNTSLRRLFVGTCVGAASAVLLLSILTKTGHDSIGWLLAAVLPVNFARGLIIPTFETLVNNYIPHNHASERATILSIASLLRSLLILLLAIPASGHSGATTTIGWAIPAGLLFVTAIVGNFILKRLQRKAPDVIGLRTAQPALPEEEQS